MKSNSSGIYGQAQYYPGENASGTTVSGDGTGLTARVGYLSGPINISLATGQTQYAKTATTGDINSTNLGVQYQIDNFRLLTGFYRDVVNRTIPLNADGWTVGGVLTIGASEVKIAFSEYGTDATGNPAVKKLSLGYVHNLSKRTAMYGTLAQVSNSGGASTALNGASTAANSSSSGFDIGIRHSF